MDCRFVLAASRQAARSSDGRTWLLKCPPYPSIMFVSIRPSGQFVFVALIALSRSLLSPITKPNTRTTLFRCSLPPFPPLTSSALLHCILSTLAPGSLLLSTALDHVAFNTRGETETETETDQLAMIVRNSLYRSCPVFPSSPTTQHNTAQRSTARHSTARCPGDIIRKQPSLVFISRDL